MWLKTLDLFCMLMNKDERLDISVSRPLNNILPSSPYSHALFIKRDKFWSSSGNFRSCCCQLAVNRCSCCMSLQVLMILGLLIYHRSIFWRKASTWPAAITGTASTWHSFQVNFSIILVKLTSKNSFSKCDTTELRRLIIMWLLRLLI